MRTHRSGPLVAAAIVMICGCDVQVPLAPKQALTGIDATHMARELFTGEAHSRRAVPDTHSEGDDTRGTRTNLMLQVVHVGSNSGGCATTSATSSTGGTSALIHAVSGAGLFLVIGLEGAGSAAPYVTGAPYITVGGTTYPLVFQRRHSSGTRATELWWIPPPTPTGSPMVFSVTATFSGATYYHTMLFSVTGMRLENPVDDDAFSAGAGPTYSTIVRPTKPQSVCVEYVNGGADFARMAPHDYCGLGQFAVGYSWQQASAGSTTMSGTITGAGATDWLHSVWEIAP